MRLVPARTSLRVTYRKAGHGKYRLLAKETEILCVGQHSLFNYFSNDLSPSKLEPVPHIHAEHLQNTGQHESKQRKQDPTFLDTFCIGFVTDPG